MFSSGYEKYQCTFFIIYIMITFIGSVMSSNKVSLRLYPSHPEIGSQVTLFCQVVSGGDLAVIWKHDGMDVAENCDIYGSLDRYHCVKSSTNFTVVIDGVGLKDGGNWSCSKGIHFDNVDLRVTVPPTLTIQSYIDTNSAITPVTTSEDPPTLSTDGVLSLVCLHSCANAPQQLFWKYASTYATDTLYTSHVTYPKEGCLLKDQTGVKSVLQFNCSRLGLSGPVKVTCSDGVSLHHSVFLDCPGHPGMRLTVGEMIAIPIGGVLFIVISIIVILLLWHRCSNSNSEKPVFMATML